MDRILKSSKVLIIILLLHMTNGQNMSDNAPQGCYFESRFHRWTCNFNHWMPPLLDNDFNLGPWGAVRVNYINGTIPARAFSGLNGPMPKANTQISLVCFKNPTKLSKGIFTPNLHWVMNLQIYDCYLENGLPSKLLENLKSLQRLMIWGGRIEGFVAHDFLAGLTNLQTIYSRVRVTTGRLPLGLFDGLKNLTYIDLTDAELNVIPANWFNGLVNLEKIYISHNNIHTLPTGIFDGLTSLTEVWLHANPWNCSCELLDWSQIAGERQTYQKKSCWCHRGHAIGSRRCPCLHQQAKAPRNLCTANTAYTDRSLYCSHSRIVQVNLSNKWHC